MGSCQTRSSRGRREWSGQLECSGDDALAFVGPGGKGAGVSQSQPSFCDPNRILQTTANPEPAGVAGAGGTVTAQPVKALLWWVGMLQQPIIAQLPGGLLAGSQSQPSPSLCR